jgi:hypothetical protein
MVVGSKAEEELWGMTRKEVELVLQAGCLQQYN